MSCTSSLLMFLRISCNNEKCWVIFALMSCPGEWKLKQLLSFSCDLQRYYTGILQDQWRLLRETAHFFKQCVLQPGDFQSHKEIHTEIWNPASVWFLQIIANLITEGNSALLKKCLSWKTFSYNYWCSALSQYYVCIFMPDLPMALLKLEQFANLLPVSQAVLSHPAPSCWVPNVFSLQLPCSKFLNSALILLLQLTCYRVVESKLTAR